MTRRTDPTPAEAAELGLDQRWLDAVDALIAIANDETQTGERRRKARNAYQMATGKSLSRPGHIVMHTGSPAVLGNHRGNDADRTTAVLEGWPA